MGVAGAHGSPADLAGVVPGDRILAINGCVPRDVIEYQLLVDELSVCFELDSGGLTREVIVDRIPGLPIGLEVDGALFDRVRTCDNHCEFCFITNYRRDSVDESLGRI